MTDDERADELARELGRLTEGLSPIEKALLYAGALRDAYPEGKYVIDIQTDGGFSIRKVGEQ